jgi:hypothetical protein
VPEALVLDNVDRTLRESGAESIEISRIETPFHDGVIATRASGLLHLGTGRAVYSQYSHYAVNTAAGRALIEQAVLVDDDAYPALTSEVTALTDDVYRVLLASIKRGTTRPVSNSRTYTTPEHRTTTVSGDQ